MAAEVVNRFESVQQVRDGLKSVNYLADDGIWGVAFLADRPGKPVLMGRIGACAVFGLPGNPGSAFVTFELFAREAIGLAKPAARRASRLISTMRDTAEVGDAAASVAAAVGTLGAAWLGEGA